MKVALISIGDTIGLAIENLKVYSETNEAISEKVDIRTFHYQLVPFSSGQAKSIQTFNFSTKFDLCVQEIISYEPDVIGFSCYLWNIDYSLKLAQMLKELLPGCLIVLGGPDAGPRARELLKRKSIDIVVDGDGENPFTSILLELLNNKTPDWSYIPQICYRENGQFRQSSAMPMSTDLSKLEGVMDQVKDLEQFTNWRWPYILYETMRGCPYQCSFCLYGKSKINTKNIDVVIREIVGMLKKGYLVDLIDPTFTTFKKRAKEILTRLSEHSYSGSILIQAYPDSIDEEFIELFKKSRVVYVGMGLQTVSQQGLLASKRPKKKNKFEEAIKLLSDAGVDFYIDVLYGLPETTKEDFFATIDYLYDHGVTNWQAYRLLGLPGSPMLNDSDKYEFRFSQSPPYELLSSNTFSLSDIIECQEFIRRCFEFDNRLHSSNFKRQVKKSGSYSNVIFDSMKYAQMQNRAQHYTASGLS